jgi:hypothetical protein
MREALLARTGPYSGNLRAAFIGIAELLTGTVILATFLAFLRDDF